MILSWLDLLGAILLIGAGLYNLRRGEGRLLRAKPWWRGDPAALLTAICGGMLIAMGAVLLLYSSAYAFITG